MQKSWIDSANDGSTDFPLQNLPFGVFSVAGDGPRIGIAIGNRVLDLRACAENGLLDTLDRPVQDACCTPVLNELMALGRSAASAVRRRVMELLAEDAPANLRGRMEPLLHVAEQVTMHLPAAIGDYTDFYASVYHATNVGRLFRPDNPLLPNYKYVPIGYHGRASSIVVSDTGVKRPSGQIKPADAAVPTFAPTRLLDYELEMGCFVADGNDLGQPVPIHEAEEYIFGLCLLNDWSARDMQAWEYQPLGPFLSKNFATSISPWVVTLDALQPFRVPAFQREAGDPDPLPYLNSADDRLRGGFDVVLEAWLSSKLMRDEKLAPIMLSRGNMRDLYWTLAQMLTHHASNGCNLRPGDLLGTGTVSGPGKDSAGCLLEMTRRGTEPISLPTGEQRKFLEDGDEVVFRGYCIREGHPRIGFGECRGVVLPPE
ncbi:MAG TPA: fumarylacetoacetase [Alloacidobacterium sp.]|nr:fumarylacetoacetase [Alloacidobacterium sp.]